MNKPAADNLRSAGRHVHPATLSEEQLLEDCTVRRQRRSGPGGQHRNKVETAVIITHVSSQVHGEASERRSQEENRRRALFRLRVNLALQVRTPVEEAHFPSDLWNSRVQGGKLSINPGHADFPAILAEALDTLTAVEMDAKEAAQRLGCTSSQLIKLLQLEPRAIEMVNVHRRQNEKPIYR